MGFAWDEFSIFMFVRMICIDDFLVYDGICPLKLPFCTVFVQDMSLEAGLFLEPRWVNRPGIGAPLLVAGGVDSGSAKE